MSIQDYITDSAKAQRELLMSIADARFTMEFDFGIGYSAVAYNFVDGFDFIFSEVEEDKYVAYLMHHNGSQVMDFLVEDLNPTRAEITRSTELAYEYLRNR